MDRYCSEKYILQWTAHTKYTLPFNCNSKTLGKTKAYKAPFDEVKNALAHRCTAAYQ